MTSVKGKNLVPSPGREENLATNNDGSFLISEFVWPVNIR